MEGITSIEIVDIRVLKVKAKYGSKINNAVVDSINAAKYNRIPVQLEFGDANLRIYGHSTIESIISEYERQINI